MCPGLILGPGSEISNTDLQGWLHWLHCHFFFFSLLHRFAAFSGCHLVSFFLFVWVSLSFTVSVFCLFSFSSFFIIPLIALYRPFLVSHLLDLQSLSLFFHFLSTPSPALYPSPSIYPSFSSQPGFPEPCTVAIMSPHPPPCSLPEHLPCPTDTTRCSHPPKTTSNSQRHQSPQSVSQPGSQSASQPSAST